jgi:hypothetical protein
MMRFGIAGVKPFANYASTAILYGKPLPDPNACIGVSD